MKGLKVLYDSKGKALTKEGLDHFLKHIEVHIPVCPACARQCEWKVDDAIVGLILEPIGPEHQIGYSPVIAAACSRCWFIMTFPADKIGIM